MNIAVIDVAAESGGALSVLNDFVEYINKTEKENQWYILTSVVEINETDNVHNLMYPAIKKSWFHRIIWEKKTFPRLLKRLKIDSVVSLQNNALPSGACVQIVYFHNVFLIQKRNVFSFLKSNERKYAIYCDILGPYVRKTWRYADFLVVQTESVKTQIQNYNRKLPIEVIAPTMKQQAVKNHSRIRGYIYPASASIYKNFEAIIQAEKWLNEQGKEIEILFTVTGTENKYAEDIRKKTEKIQGIKFIGPISREEVLAYYKDYGLIMTSKYETFSMPIMEAKLCNTVIVGIDLPYVHEVTRNYNRVYICQESDLGETLEKGLNDINEGNFDGTSEDSWKKFVNLILKLNNPEGKLKWDIK